MRSFVTLALFAVVATSALRVHDDAKGDSTDKKETHTDAEVKVGTFAFKKAADGDRISAGNNATTPYEVPLAEKIQDKRQIDAITDKWEHSTKVLNDAIAGEKKAKEDAEGKKEAKVEEKKGKEEKKAL